MISMSCSTWLNAEQLSKAIEKLAVNRMKFCALAIQREAKQSLKRGGRTESRESRIKKAEAKAAKGQALMDKGKDAAGRSTVKRGRNMIARAISMHNDAINWDPMSEGFYYNSALGRYVQASKPGEPPHSQTGTLRNSIRTQMVSRTRIRVGPTKVAHYGAILEFGGKHMAPRPFMLPALLKVRSEFKAIFKGIHITGLGD